MKWIEGPSLLLLGTLHAQTYVAALKHVAVAPVRSVAERLQLRAHAQVGTCRCRSYCDEGYRSHDGEQTGAQAPRR